MHEYVQVPTRSGARFIQDTRARGPQPFYSGGEVRDFERYVMNAFAALFDELRNDGIRLGRLEEFDAWITHRQHCRRDLLAGNRLPKRDL